VALVKFGRLLPRRCRSRSKLQFSSAASSATFDRVRSFVFVRRPVLIRSTRLERRTSRVRALILKDSDFEAGTFSDDTARGIHRASADPSSQDAQVTNSPFQPSQNSTCSASVRVFVSHLRAWLNLVLAHNASLLIRWASISESVLVFERGAKQLSKDAYNANDKRLARADKELTRFKMDHRYRWDCRSHSNWSNVGSVHFQVRRRRVCHVATSRLSLLTAVHCSSKLRAHHANKSTSTTREGSGYVVADSRSWRRMYNTHVPR